VDNVWQKRSGRMDAKEQSEQEVGTLISDTVKLLMKLNNYILSLEDENKKLKEIINALPNRNSSEQQNDTELPIFRVRD